MFVTFFDTCMVSLAALIVWRLSPIFVFIPWVAIACLDGLFLSSALTKVPDGAWFTLTLAGLLACVFILWRFGKEQQWNAEATDRFPTTHLVEKGEGGQVQLTERYGKGTLSTIKGFGIFFDKAGEMTPIVFSQFLSKLVAAPEVMVFFHLRPLETPSVLPEERYRVTRMAIPNCYRVIVRHGYMDEVITPDIGSLIYEQIRDFIIRQRAPPKSPNPLQDIPPPTQENTATPTQQSGDNGGTITARSHISVPETLEQQNADDALTANLSKLQQAYDHQVLYIIGKEQMKVKVGTGVWRTISLRIFLWLRENTRTKIANLRVPIERVIEVGFVKEV
jgi:KUP system potassium uptake protein